MHIAYHEERERLLTLRQILRNSGPDPAEADLQSAKLAIKGFVKFARLKERQRQAATRQSPDTPAVLRR